VRTIAVNQHRRVTSASTPVIADRLRDHLGALHSVATLSPTDDPRMFSWQVVDHPESQGHLRFDGFVMLTDTPYGTEIWVNGGARFSDAASGAGTTIRGIAQSAFKAALLAICIDIAVAIEDLGMGHGPPTIAA